MSDSFDLRRVLCSIEIVPEDHVYINWYRFDKLDRMAVDDLAQYFDDVWYPSSDDIDLFDSTLSWVLSVTDEGYIRFVKFKQEKVPGTESRS